MDLEVDIGIINEIRTGLGLEEGIFDQVDLSSGLSSGLSTGDELASCFPVSSLAAASFAVFGVALS